MAERWTCPHCDREFGRARQSHLCVPGCTVEETFAGRPPVQREIYDRIVAFVETLGPIHLDVVRVGIFLKRVATVVEIRPMARALSVEIVLPREIRNPRVTRTWPGRRVVHVVRLTSVDQVDEQLEDWLTEAYDAADAT